MPFNGSGTFNRVYNWVTDKNNSINITASRVDTEDTGFATGLSNTICKDGQSTPTANLPMGGFAHTGVGNATTANQYGVVSQIQNSSYNWIAGGGTGDAITATYSPAITTLVDGMELSFRSPGANTLTNPTFSPNGITAHTITKNGGSALAANDIPAPLFEGKLRYNLANTRWELQNPSPSTVSTAPFVDTTALVKGSSDATKQFRIEVDGNTTGTTRVMTPPDADFTAVGTTTTQTLTNKTLTNAIVGTQSANDNSTKAASTAYADRAAVLVKYAFSNVTAYTAYTGVTLIPFDNTIPQNTEGVEWGSITYTPISASNRLVIRAIVQVGETSNTQQAFAQALFQDSTVGALAASVLGCASQPAVAYPAFLITEYEMTAGTTSATTFKARFSGDIGTALEINGNGGSRLFGGVLASKIEVWEYTP